MLGRTDILLIDDAGDFHVVRKAEEGSIPTEIDGRQIVNALCFGPMLVEDGKVCQIERNDFMASEKLRARVALCQMGPLHYAVVCCSGPSMGNKGMTLQSFADLLGQLGVQSAYNLGWRQQRHDVYRGSDAECQPLDPRDQRHCLFCVRLAG